MTKPLVTFCLALFLICSALSGKSQATIPLKFQELARSIVAGLPGETPSAQLVGFAKTLIGIPYRYASSNPDRGFDCSGFVNYVFEKFGFNVPRSSTEFFEAGTAIDLENAKVGDVLVFTGTNPKIRRAGHVGIICSVNDEGIRFIHASSGKAHGVTITTMNAYYKSRFMKVISIL